MKFAALEISLGSLDGTEARAIPVNAQLAAEDAASFHDPAELST